MNPTLLFLFVGLPIVVGIAGIFAGETFRAKSLAATPPMPKDMESKEDVALLDIVADVHALTVMGVLKESEEITKPQIERRPEDYGQYWQLRNSLVHGLDFRHRDAGGVITQRRGDVLVGTLRRTYGENFAQGVRSDTKLRDVLRKLDRESLSKLVHDYEAGTLYSVLEFSRFLSRLG